MKSYSQMKVYPVNWETSKKSVSKDWIVRYVFTDNKGYEHNCSFKGMNHIKDHAERVKETKQLLIEEMQMLDSGYNPKTKEFEKIEGAPAINIDTPFIQALQVAIDNNPGVPSHIADMENTLKHVVKYSSQLRFHSKRIKDITKGDIKQLLLRMTNDGHSNYRINKTKAHLSGCFKFFTELDIFDTNFIKGISNLDHSPSKKEIIRTDEDFRKFHKIKDINRNVYVFLYIFFCSGSRFEEMTQVKKEDVHLDRSFFWVNLKKGGKHTRSMRPINMKAWKYWKEIYDLAGPNQYLFSYHQLPNDTPVKANSMYDISAKYLRMVGLNITGYALKGSWLNLVSKEHGLTKAQELAGHTTPNTTKLYAVDYEEHQVERNKDISVNF